MNLEIRQSLLAETESETIPTNELIKMRNAHINGDLMIQALVNNISEQQQLLIFERHTKAPTHPDLKFREELIESLNQNMEKRRELVGKEFDESIAVELSRKNESKLGSVKVELDQTRFFLETYKKMLQDEENATQNVGRIQLDIQDLIDQLNITKDMYDRVRKAIQEVELESKRPARVSVYYEANTGQLQDNRKKLILVMLMGALAGGMLIGFLRSKWDVCLRIPEDVIRYIDVPVIGTTTGMHQAIQAVLPERIASDYQTIRANLGLVGGQGIPKILAVTSPGMREGKTTFSINLAASMATAKSRVLLIDGDFRKPEIKNTLSINGKSGGLQKVLFGTCGFEQAVVKLPEIGLHVLTADPFNISETFDILARPRTREILRDIGANYDHIIIDTPPILNTPDALLWAKLADAAVLISFSGQTQGPDLREAYDRLIAVNVNVLGTVLNSVSHKDVYQGYYYGRPYVKDHKKKYGKHHGDRPIFLAKGTEKYKPS